MTGIKEPSFGVSGGGVPWPSLTGYAIGQHYRRRLPEEKFRRVFFADLLLVGAHTFVTRIVFEALGPISERDDPPP